MPPCALISATAISAAFFMLVPSAYPPGGESGPTQPMAIGSAAPARRPSSGKEAAAPARASRARLLGVARLPGAALLAVTGALLRLVAHPRNKLRSRQGEPAAVLAL